MTDGRSDEWMDIDLHVFHNTSNQCIKVNITTINVNMYINSAQLNKIMKTYKFISSPVKDSIVVNDRWGSDTNCKHGDYKTCNDEYNPGM